MKTNIWTYLIIAGVAVLGVSANAMALDVIANVQSIQSLTLKTVTIPNISRVVPNGEFSESISGSAWRIVAPIRVTVSIQNNSTAQFVTYTDHVHQSAYWTRNDNANFEAVATDPNRRLNGLVNVSALTPNNVGQATVPIRVWANVDNSATESNKESDWIWVLDESFGTAALPILSGNAAVISNSDLSLLYRMSWNAEKLPGTYTGKLFIGLVSQ